MLTVQSEFMEIESALARRFSLVNALAISIQKNLENSKNARFLALRCIKKRGEHWSTAPYLLHLLKKNYKKKKIEGLQARGPACLNGTTTRGPARGQFQIGHNQLTHQPQTEKHEDKIRNPSYLAEEVEKGPDRR